jgi:hypothetical protein
VTITDASTYFLSSSPINHISTKFLPFFPIHYVSGGGGGRGSSLSLQCPACWTIFHLLSFNAPKNNFNPSLTLSTWTMILFLSPTSTLLTRCVVCLETYPILLQLNSFSLLMSFKILSFPIINIYMTDWLIDD